MRLNKAPGDMKDSSFILDVINVKLGECGVGMFSFKWNKHGTIHHDGETILLDRRLLRRTPHRHSHGHTPPRETRHLR